VLALVALFTGAFLVFSTQALSIVRRRPQIALLCALGASRGRITRMLQTNGKTIASQMTQELGRE
jgi:putative ABC transport system permease protein